jgi:hypothetical protein
VAVRADQKDIKGRLATGPAQDKFLDLLQQGWDLSPAAREVGRTPEGVKFWRKSDPGFDERVKTILARRAGQTWECPDFPEFCERYLGQKLFPHQLRWFDILEGRVPRDMHPSMKWAPGDPQMLLFNVPPGFAKSTTLTVNYVVWRICRDPNIRVVVVSATQRLAKQFLGAIKTRLSHDSYSDLQHHFGPDGGFKATAESWTQTEIYLGGKNDGEKDPTVQAIGMGSQIYGTRADLILCDDVVLLDNAHRWEEQLDWLTQEVVTRLPEADDSEFEWGTGQNCPDQKLLVVGTRVAPVDIYLKLREQFTDDEGNSVFTYFSQPAVLEYADDPKDWVSLWPFTEDRDGNLVPKWTGTQLAKRRQKVKASTWSLVYQQLDANVDGVFDEALVRAAVQDLRKPGPLVPGDQPHQRPLGMRNLYVVAGLDPATSGFTASVVLGVDRSAKRVWLLDAFNKSGTSNREMRDLIERWTTKYQVNEWRIEENAFQRFLVQDDSLRGFLFSRGVILKGHHTGQNKSDPDFGVASMSTLFEPQADGTPSIWLPNANVGNLPIAQLVDQLIVWQPEAKHRSDLVMALWFAVKRARELIYRAPSGARTHMVNPFLSRGRRGLQTVVNLQDIEAEILTGGG